MTHERTANTRFNLSSVQAKDVSPLPFGDTSGSYVWKKYSFAPLTIQLLKGK
jgi:hypothetical protein